MMAWFTGTATPLILMLVGAPTDMKMSEAFLSAITWNSRFIADILSPLFLCLPQSPRSSSFRVVLARVFASTFLTMTAQYRPQLLSGEGKLPENTHGNDAVFLDDHALHHLRACPDEAIVLDDHRVRLDQLEHAPDAHPARKVHVLADLGARADRGPGVDHGALVDVGADVHVGGHQHDVARHVGAAPCHRRGHHADAARREVEVLKLGRHLVEIPGRASLHHAVVLEPKRKQHGLLDPLVRDPFAARLLGHAQPPGVEPGDHLLDRLAQRARRVSGVEGGSFLPGLLDDVLHSCLANRLIRLTASTHSSVGATSASRTRFLPGFSPSTDLAR